MPQQLLTNFGGGEISFDLYGRPDADLYFGSGKRMQNFIARQQGPMEYRGGAMYVHASASNNSPRIERFRFNDEQVYILEFTDSILRIYEDAALTLETTSKNITGATQADPVVITSTAHGFSDGDEVYIASVSGMTELNGRFFRVSNSTANTFELTDLFDNDVDGTGFTAYTSGGTITKVFEVTSPYTTAQLFEFDFAQQGNVAYFVHRSVAPYKLTRVSSTSWTFATYARTNDPFIGANDYPGAVGFYEGRSVFASTNNNPDSSWLSRSPTSAGASRFDDFTTGSNADDAIIFPITSDQGDIVYINWLVGLEDFIAYGTTGGIVGVNGGGVDDAITPTNIKRRPLDPYGAQALAPVANGNTLYYIQKGGRILRSFEYELLSDGYRSSNRSFVSTHLTKTGVKQMAFQRGKSDILWMVRNDGVLIGVTIKAKEDPSGWHRHVLGGTAVKVLSVAVEPQDQGFDRVWIVVERTINSTTVRYVEYFTDPFEGELFSNYYTDDETADTAAYENEIYEQQKALTYLDSFLTFDGSVLSGNPTCTPAATTGTGITFTASSSIFVSGDVGKKIFKKYQDRAGGGVALITGYTSGTQVVCTIESDFDNTNAIAAGDWYLTADAISGIHHLEGQTVQVMTDGRTHPDVTVTNGAISLTRQAGVVHIGFKFIGLFISNDLVLAAQNGNILTNNKNVIDVDLIFAHTIGSKFGTSLYNLKQITSSVSGQATDRPPLPFTGVESNFYEDTWQEKKELIVVQDQPYPCVVTAANLTLDAGER